MPEVIDPITGRKKRLPYPGEEQAPSQTGVRIGPGGAVLPADRVPSRRAQPPGEEIDLEGPALGGRGAVDVATPLTPEQARETRARDPEARREAKRERTRLTKKQEAQAALAMMKQREGRQPTAAEAEALRLWEQAGQMRSAAQQRTVVRQRNPLYEERKEHIQRTGEAQTEVAEAQREQVGAAVQHAENIEAFRARMALEEEMVQQGLAAKEQTRQEALDESQSAVQEASRLVTQASEKLARVPGVEPGRYWASRTAGQKFGAIMLAIVRGMMGHENMTSHIQDAINEDIMAQKEQIAAAERQYGTRIGAFESQLTLANEVRSQVDDERTADKILELARWKQAETELQHWMSKGMTAQAQASAGEHMAQIKQKQADLSMQLAQAAQNNPRMFTRVRRTLPADVRSDLRERARAMEEHALGALSEQQKQAGRMQIEGERARQKAIADEAKKMRGEGGIVRQAQWFAEKAGTAEGVLRQIDSILAMEDIPGVHALGSDFWATEEGRRMKASIDSIKEQFGRLQSQGVISPVEREDFDDMILRAVQFPVVGGENRLRINLEELRKGVASKVESFERAIEPEAREYYRKNRNLPEFKEEFSGSTIQPSSAVAEHE